MISLSGFLKFVLPFSILYIPWRTQLSLKHTSILGRFLQGAMRPNSRTTAQWALVSWLLSLLTFETTGGLAATLVEEAKPGLFTAGHSLLFYCSSSPLTPTYFSSPAPLSTPR